jgi:hypothetical protein
VSKFRFEDAAIASIAFALAASLWVQSAFVAALVRSHSGTMGFTAALPVPPLFIPTHPELLGAKASAIFVGIGVIQAALLFVLRYRLVRSIRPIALACCAVAFGVMIAFDLTSPAATSSDAYAYIGYAKLGSIHAAYAPPETSLPGTFALVNSIWGLPLPPCVYGPLWIEAMHFLVGSATTLAIAFGTLRVLGALAFVLLLYLIYLWSRSPVLTVLLGLAPPLHAMFVMDAHNDILAVLPIVGAFLAVRRGWWLPALLFVLLGATVKINLALMGMMAVFWWPSLGRRLLFGAAIVGLVGLTYFASTGTTFIDAVLQLKLGGSPGALHRPETARLFDGIGKVALALLAVATVAIGLVWRRVWIGASGLFVALGAGAVQPWYVLWGLPYALTNGPAAELYVCILPLFAVLLEGEMRFGGHGTLVVAIAAVCILAFAGLVDRERSWRQPLGAAMPGGNG